MNNHLIFLINNYQLRNLSICSYLLILILHEFIKLLFLVFNMVIVEFYLTNIIMVKNVKNLMIIIFIMIYKLHDFVITNINYQIFNYYHQKLKIPLIIHYLFHFLI